MNIIEKEITAKSYLTKSNLPASDYVINPYVGCPHACQYCYARFMKRFTGHIENWGEFIDIKRCNKPIQTKNLRQKSVFISSVTDCYNPYEEKYQLTRNILEQLKEADCTLTLSTKSDLVLRDIDLLKQLKHLTVAMSINTLDENFRQDMDHASCISKRIAALKELHSNGIHTVLFMSPIFPYITDFEEIIEETSDFVYEYWFENLNLRGDYKHKILDYIAEKYPQYIDGYKRIYTQGDINYWQRLSNDIDEYCRNNKIHYTNYFYHNLLVADKMKNTKKSSKTSRSS